MTSAACNVVDALRWRSSLRTLRRRSKLPTATHVRDVHIALSAVLHIVACICCCCVSGASTASSIFHNYSNACLPISAAVMEYCNLPEFFTNGEEGQVAPAGHKLLKAIVLTRHGSRHVMHHTRFGPLAQPRQSCRLEPDVLASVVGQDVRLPSLLAQFVRDVARGLRRGRNSSTAAAATPHWSYPPAPEVPLCGHAHLTPLGVAQQLRVGLALRDAYGDGQLNLTNVHVRSTDTRRTYQSAVALLYGLLGPASAAIPISKVEAQHENFCDETVVAHFSDLHPSTCSSDSFDSACSVTTSSFSSSSSSNVGTAAAAATAPLPGDSAVSGCHCPSVKRLKKQARAELKERLRPADRAYERFLSAAERVFRGRDRAKPEYPWKRALDHAAALSLCSRRGCGPLPCYRGRCFASRDVDDLWTHLSAYFESMSQHETFAHKSRIEMQPFLWQVLQLVGGSPSQGDSRGSPSQGDSRGSTPATAPLETAGCGSSSSSSSNVDCGAPAGTAAASATEKASAAVTWAAHEADRDLHVYSGHDVTITALALAMGVPFTRWPPYASTLVLEVYERLSDGSRHLRVLYAGRDVTERVRFFRAPSRLLCPWEAFAEFALAGNLRELGYDSWQAACA